MVAGSELQSSHVPWQRSFNFAEMLIFKNFANVTGLGDMSYLSWYEVFLLLSFVEQEYLL